MPDLDIARAQPTGGAPGYSRRSVVAGAGIVAIGAALPVAGCSIDSASSGGGSGSAAAGPGTVLGPVSDVPAGGGKVYKAQRVVVTQPTPGSYQGLSAVCTHQGCIVNTIANGTIDCPCHGSRYHLDGTVAAGPAPSPLPSRPVTVTNGQITLA